METPTPPTATKPSRLVALVALVAAATVVVGLGAWLVVGAVSGSSVPGPPPASTGAVVNRTVPASVLGLRLTDQRGHVVTLHQLRGKTVLLAPFLTSCQEQCPLTTAALSQVVRTVAADGLSSKVVVAEVSVDPARDTPSRMAAYAKLTGYPGLLLTADAATLAQLWKFFGVYSHSVPEGTPPGTDWQTGQPYTYDVQHSDGFIVVSPDSTERFFAVGMVKLPSASPTVRKLLNGQGLHNFAHPGAGAWTTADALDAIGWVMGRAVPGAG